MGESKGVGLYACMHMRVWYSSFVSKVICLCLMSVRFTSFFITFKLGARDVCHVYRFLNNNKKIRWEIQQISNFVRIYKQIALDFWYAKDGLTAQVHRQHERYAAAMAAALLLYMVYIFSSIVYSFCTNVINICLLRL